MSAAGGSAVSARSSAADPASARSAGGGAVAAAGSGAAAGGAVVKEGYLVKRSQWLHEWRRRYFKLVGNNLFFSKDPRAPPHGNIDLSSCLTVKSAEEKTGKPFSFEVATTDELFYLCASTNEEKDEWIGVIGRSIVQGSRSFQPERTDAHDDDDDDDDDDEPYMPYR